MKKIFFLIFSLFLFSCSNNFEAEILTGKIEEKNQELQDCIDKSPFNGENIYFNNYKPDIYWTFKNDGKCYYLGFAKNFFLLDENTDKNLYFDYANKLYREEALDNHFRDIIGKYGLGFPQELPPIYLFFPNTLEIFQKYLKKENITLPEKYILVEKNNIEKFKDKLNMTKKSWQEHSNQELNIKETLDLNIENLYQTLLDLQKNS